MEQVLPVKKKKGGKMPGAGRPQKFKNQFSVTIGLSVPESKVGYVRKLIAELKEKWLLEEQEQYLQQQLEDL